MVNENLEGMSESQLEAVIMRNMSTMHALRLQMEETRQKLMSLAVQNTEATDLFT
jgi:hypothetical protein